ncbi:MAG TPA: CBS domain-containing protein, partial [Candidatus Atribacteria bacterium]|nr:CBS domain-containing protein [Candidatus Atribacteria bacterium]
MSSPRVEEITVEDVMTRDLITVPPTTTIDKVAVLMKEHNIGSIIIVDDKGNPVGIVTERDLVVKVLANNLNSSDVQVKSIMSSPVISVNVKASLVDAAKLMARRNIR